MGKTRDLFKKIRDTNGIFHAKMGTIKDRNGMDRTELNWYIVHMYKEEFIKDYKFTIILGHLSSMVYLQHFISLIFDQLELNNF